MIDKENFDERLANKFRKELDDYEVEYNPMDWEKLRPRLKPPVFTNIWKNDSWKPLSMAVAAALSLLIVAYAYWSQIDPIQISEKQTLVLRENKTTDRHAPDSAAHTLAELSKAQSEKIDALSKNSPNNGAENRTLKKDNPKEVNKSEKIASHNHKKPSNKLLNQNKVNDKNDSRLALNRLKENIAEKQEDDIVKHKISEQEKITQQSPISEQKKTVFVQLIELDSMHFAYAPPAYAQNLDLELKNITSSKASDQLPAKMTLGMVLNTLTYQNVIENASSLEMGLQIDLPISRKLHLIPSLLIAQQQMEFRRERLMVKETLPPPNITNIGTSVNPSPTHRNTFITQHAHNELTILNLPIDLQYDLIESGKWKIFLRGGISNYAYIVEKYQFASNISSVSTDFTLMSSPNYTNYTTYTERKHQSFSHIDFFAGLNFGTGIQYAASKHLFVQAVPFYRLPTRKVAHENMEFNTYGLSLIVGYK
ncbi:outer membrane beta-barrel protein [Thermoflexibacter ruber]|uniref:Outer membrane protein beta-barrel domain-containing protein n=1 Tax=Thermoflexibacter ruber TaxID=1003 RepID=A0A1I2FH14_9BACT|nr:outer membrane beta-barrel protein [Thermoflexibacter ruber]SFF03751.1 Outer membrane protein beta-barrel domain-containing protein [Thermoflexibacter ruber]